MIPLDHPCDFCPLCPATEKPWGCHFQGKLPKAGLAKIATQMMARTMANPILTPMGKREMAAGAASSSCASPGWVAPGKFGCLSVEL